MADGDHSSGQQQSSGGTRLDGRHALVTGASSGLGHHFAQLLASAGAKVTIAARRAERLQGLKETIEASGGAANAVTMDVTEMAAIDSAFDAAAAWGGVPDIVVNNAGIAETKSALDHTPEIWDSVVGTNLRGVFFVAQAAAKRLIAAGKPGSIINIASVTGLRPINGIVAYATAKAGVIHMTKCLGLEWARNGIRVNGIAPGYIETEINSDFFKTEQGAKIIARIPQRRIGQPDVLDGALMLLAGEQGNFMTGETIAVDGGHMIQSL